MRKGGAYIVPGGMCRKGLKTIRHPRRYGLMWKVVFFYCRNYWFELSPDGWLLTGTIWIWRVPRVKGYGGSIDELVEPSMRSVGSKHGRIISLRLQHDCNTMELLSCLLHRSCHRHTTALMPFTLDLHGLFRPKRPLLAQTTKQQNE